MEGSASWLPESGSSQLSFFLRLGKKLPSSMPPLMNGNATYWLEGLMIGLSRAQVVDCKWFSVHCQFKRQDTHNCSSVFIPFSSQRSELQSALGL